MTFKTAMETLNRLRLEMGAPQKDWQPSRRHGIATTFAHEPIDREVHLDDLTTGPGDTILLGGLRVFLYIREFRVNADSFDEAASEPSRLRKFHVAWCDVLRRMRSEGRFERYVVSNRIRSPFELALKLTDGTYACGDAELHVCRVCLNHVDWGGFRSSRRQDKNRIVDQFSRSRFLETEHTNFAALPNRTDASAPDLGYAADWNVLSREFRTLREWRCQDCKVDCSSQKHLLDTHHVNGVTGDNRFSNLRALCKDCHAKQHPGHYRVSDNDRRLLAELRKQQGLAPTP
jgi:hypothetical protein